MKRLLFPLTASLCLLTACPSTTPEPLKIPDGPAALNGTWQGTLTSAVTWQPLTAGGGQLYLLRREQALSWRADSAQPPRATAHLVALDERTGQEVRRVVWSSDARNFSFLAASGTRPARLLSIEVQSSRSWVVERDPLTLEELDRWTPPLNGDALQLSADGTRLALMSRQLLDPRTRQVIPLRPEVEQALRQLPSDARADWGGDLRWLILRRWVKSSGGSVERVSLISNDTGQTLNGQALHPLGCGLTPERGLSYLTAVAPLSDGVALAYEDGAIELRRADGTLRTTVQTGSCSVPELRVDGDTLTFKVAGGQGGGQLGTVRVSDGQVTAQISQEPSYSGLLLPGAVLNRFGGTLAYQQLNGLSWRKEGPFKQLRLDAKATWVSKSEYHVTGEARIDDQPLTFTAKATAFGIELRPQLSYPIPEVRWVGELRRADGSLYGRLEGSHRSASTEQETSLELAGVEDDFAFGGSLTR
ncbi:hypothetical protein [Deinococcus sp. QL22]|uniref:hypothetical protein n=1 Tax=Deinococcus sp. QL22 TaxID=2939437 RepID=UPI0020177FF3|nr:hypothetical protein [Deinococcus sp. QL22]UQN08067.1 hypothetical protein M1R55_18425 [Deinococcus sp. QL22]